MLSLNINLLGSTPQDASIDQENTDNLSELKGKNTKLELLRKSINKSFFNQDSQSQLNLSFGNSCSSPQSEEIQSSCSVDHKSEDIETISPFQSRLKKFRNSVKSSLFLTTPKNSNFSQDQISEEDSISEKPLTSFTSFLKEETYQKENLDSIKSSAESEIREGSSENALEEKIGDETSHFSEVDGVIPLRDTFVESRVNEVEELKKDLGIEENPFIQFIKGDFSEYYKEGEILGEGTTGVVKECTKTNNTETFAVKIVQYRGDSEVLILIIQEFENLRKLNHKNVMKVYELFVDYYKNKVYIIMELSECREMFDVLQDLGHYSEAVASGIFKQILNGINYLHLNGVCHRDIKPNNILVSKDGKTVKIADFNVSKFTKKGQGKLKYTSLSTENHKMWTYTGTIAFSAPEIFLDSEYSEIVDSWSAGVVLYMMLCGYQPFQADYMDELIEMIKTGKYEFHEDQWSNISEQAKNLIKHCLDVNYKTRYTPSQALMHPWITNQGKVPDVKISNIKENYRVYYKAYEGNKEDIKNSEHMKKMQVTSPTISVASPFVNRVKKRSGTTRMNNTYLNKLLKPVSTEKEINGLLRYVKKISEGEVEVEENSSEKNENKSIDHDESFGKSLNGKVIEAIKSEEEFDNFQGNILMLENKCIQEELEKRVSVH